jgi:hypothetical protein
VLRRRSLAAETEPQQDFFHQTPFGEAGLEQVGADARWILALSFVAFFTRMGRAKHGPL